MAPAAPDEALPVHFRCGHSYASAPDTQFRPKFDLTCQILAAKIEQFIQTLGRFCNLAPFFGPALEKDITWGLDGQD